MPLSFIGSQWLRPNPKDSDHRQTEAPDPSNEKPQDGRAGWTKWWMVPFKVN